MTTPTIHTHLLPSLIGDRSLARSTVVVMDVLRATSTAAGWLAAGAAGMIPVESVEEAEALADQMKPRPLLGGERGGRRIPGFDLGNSPQVEPAQVAGRWIVFTTTNGTRAIHACRGAREVLLGAFVNLSAVCDYLVDRDTVDLVCAGTDGKVTQEDVLCAGAIIDQWSGGDPSDWTLDDASRIAWDAWQAHRRHWTGSTWLVDALRSSHGGQNLAGIGEAADIELAAHIDHAPLVPRWEWPANRITAAR